MKVSEWNNLERIMVFVRFDIENSSNIDILKIVEAFISSQITGKELYDKAVDIREEWKNQLLIEMENDEAISDSDECLFFKKYLKCAIKSLDKRNYQEAYDIIDMLQAFPGVVLHGERGSKKSFEKIYLVPLLAKWNIV